MIRSMTGYGCGLAADEHRKYRVEIRSVNHKYSDISIKMPRGFMALEDRVKGTVSAKLKRGKMDVFVSYTDISCDENMITADIPLARSYYKALTQLSEGLGLNGDDKDISLSLITKYTDVIKVDQEEKNLDTQWEILKQATEAAVDMLYTMSCREAEYLIATMKNGVENIHNTLDEIKALAPKAIEANLAKYRQRIATMLEGSAPDEQRILQEAAIMTDRYDINEETVRLSSHIKQFGTIIAENDQIGKKLDFLVQEMNRETNTIGSKANDIEITKRVMYIKNEIEKLREQIQNIE